MAGIKVSSRSIVCRPTTAAIEESPVSVVAVAHQLALMITHIRIMGIVLFQGSFETADSRIAVWLNDLYCKRNSRQRGAGQANATY